jgi:hypothetical protein
VEDTNPLFTRKGNAWANRNENRSEKREQLRRTNFTMKEKPNWTEIETRLDFESVSQKLLNLSAAGKLKRRKSASDLLDKVKDALLKARADGVSFATLAAYLTENGLPVSEPTIRQYLHAQGADKRRPRRKIAVALKPDTQQQPKPQPEPQPEPRPETKPVQNLIERSRADAPLPPRRSLGERIRGPRIADPRTV